ncbi:MAG: hypothetical protein HKN22_04005 [Bacteroidia bacterium]|nr:hypothetical protein [Bacteroidia bacterium]
MLKNVYYNRILPEIYRLKYKKIIDNYSTYAMFIGYPRSSHSLVGAILDAHKNVIIGHEVNVIRLLERGFKTDFILARIISKAELFLKTEGSRTGYKYLIPNQFNGKFESVKVIGDKKGGSSTRHLTRDLSLIHRVDKFKRNVKVYHVIRNPFDNIASMARGGNLVRREVTPEVLDDSIKSYFESVSTVQKVKDLNKYEIYELHISNLLNDPEKYIRELFAFINIEIDSKFVEDCNSILFKNPKRTRDAVQWSEEQLKQVQDQCGEFEFLKHYTFNSD